MQEFSLVHKVQTKSGAQPAPYPTGTGALSSGVKLTIHLHLVPRSRKVELYLHSTIRLHGVVLSNEAQKHRDKCTLTVTSYLLTYLLTYLLIYLLTYSWS
jgi:hypothetical protein